MWLHEFNVAIEHVQNRLAPGQRNLKPGTSSCPCVPRTGSQPAGRVLPAKPLIISFEPQCQGHRVLNWPGRTSRVGFSRDRASQVSPCDRLALAAPSSQHCLLTGAQWNGHGSAYITRVCCQVHQKSRWPGRLQGVHSALCPMPQTRVTRARRV